MPKLRTATSTRYYLKRLWKISWVCVRDGRNRLIRIVKHYERRQSIGAPWQHVRSIAQEAKANV